ncbi:hypothetical protein K0M31_019982 [Melipona bicolor]|uniref:Uncharacterized protein n=1 Tax=Melipona bicolor TaxID=60889 RepID=A0AA40G0Q5_9HYME|nr:hypothetical protein K0M31_019982 [Melipona bicolor]
MLRGLLSSFLVLLFVPVFIGFTFAVVTRRYVHLGSIFTDRAQQQWWADIFRTIHILYFGRRNKGNVDRVADDQGRSAQDANNSVDTSSTMSENPVSFVVGGPDIDPSEELEIEDSFPSDANDFGGLSPQQTSMVGLIERRKRLR